MSTEMTLSFQVDRDDYTHHRIVETPSEELGEGEIRVRVDRFAFTANNMTYAVAGDLLRYWQFFPVLETDEHNWGQIPVWGFGDVVESRCADVPEGDRLYGYFPPASSLVIQPTEVSTGSLVDGVEHRQVLPPLYNRYRRVLAEPDYDQRHDDATVLLAPLHLTSFVLAHRLASRGHHGAEQVVIVSASSKTSLGLAYALSRSEGAPSVVGVTSSHNVDFTRSSGLYDLVLTYEAIAEELPTRPTVVVDMAGDSAVALVLRDRLGPDLAFTILVGLTHWAHSETVTGSVDRPDPTTQENFFAPSYIRELVKASGPGEFDRNANAFLRDAAAITFGLMSVDRRSGLRQLPGAYEQVRDGTLLPSAGLVIEP